MKRQIRFGVFETNSSSVHSLTIVDAETFEKFKAGELLLNWDCEFVEATEENLEDEDNRTFKNYSRDFERFSSSYTTKSGDKVVAFGYYGDDN